MPVQRWYAWRTGLLWAGQIAVARIVTFRSRTADTACSKACRNEKFMLIEFSIIPLGKDTHISAEVAEALKIVHASGVPYQLTPLGTCLEGDWDELMPIIRR